MSVQWNGDESPVQKLFKIEFEAYVAKFTNLRVN
jgi:hypothetical protein